MKKRDTFFFRDLISGLEKYKIAGCNLSFCGVGYFSGGRVDAISLKEGMVFEHGDGLYVVISAVHTHQQQRRGLVRLKAREVSGGKTIDDSFRSDVKFNVVHIEEKPLTYLYADADSYYFMDNSSYEQYHVSEGVVGDRRDFLKENTEISGLFHQNRLIDIKMPVSVELKVIEAEPEHKGNTVQGGKKRVKLETGIVIQAPLFISVDDIVKVDTRTGEYVTRV